jgi:hypothetical protein
MVGLSTTQLQLMNMTPPRIMTSQFSGALCQQQPQSIPSGEPDQEPAIPIATINPGLRPWTDIADNELIGYKMDPRAPIMEDHRVAPEAHPGILQSTVAMVEEHPSWPEHPRPK